MNYELSTMNYEHIPNRTSWARRMQRAFFYYILLFSLLLMTPPVSADNSATKIFTTINLRLGYMQDVALYKAIHHKPIEDRQREKVVINKAVIAMQHKGLNPDQGKSLIMALISVAKAVEYRYRADYLSTAPTHSPRDLNNVIRPALIRLTAQLIAQLAAYLQVHESFKQQQFSEFTKIINTKYVTMADKQLLFKALKSVTL